MDLSSSNGYANNDIQHQEIAPSFLFGDRTQKRKALALNSRSTGFGSPGILKKDITASSPGKNVRWSSELVQEQIFSNKPGNSIAATSLTVTSPSFASGPTFTSPISKGPPLSSLDFEPPTKLQRPDVKLDQKEAALAAINSNLNAFNTTSDSCDYWVTVYGFTPSDRDVILNKFSRHGNIVSHNIPQVGNWIHIRYSSVLHAQQALNLDGNIIGGRLMIGVVKCTDKEVVLDSKMNPLNASSMNFTDVSFGNPVMQSTIKNINDDNHIDSSRASISYSEAASFDRSRLSALSRNGMRSLQASAVDVSLDTSVRKDESFFAKFWNFVAPQ